MGTNKKKQEQSAQLRNKAERMVMEKKFHPSSAVFEDPLKLIHELQTFQIELELQNEALRNAQDALEKSEHNYTQLYEFAPVGYITVNPKGVILKSNLTFAGMLSIERKDLIDHFLSDYIHSEDQDIYYRYLRDLSDLKTLQVCELRLQKKKGPPFDVQLESTVVPCETKTSWQYRIAIMDIGERKQVEKELAKYREHLEDLVARRTARLQQEILEHKRTQAERTRVEAQLQQAKRMETIGTLAGGIAHDFNNILFPLIGFTEISLAALSENHPIKENLENILQGALRAGDLVQQILTFSSLSEVEQKPILLRPVIEEAIKLLRPTIPANIEIRQEFCVDPPFVLASSTQIYEVILNLCTNAYHAMEETGGTLKICLSRAAPGLDLNLPSGEYCCLHISDTGTGIPPDIQNKIFDPYFTTKGLGKGSGLGLSVVHGIVTSHRGAVRVESEPGQGSVFTVFLPMISQLIKTEAKPDIRTNPIGSERILFVDDEPLIVKFGIQFLNILGYQVTGKTSCTQALKLFESDPDYFDLVITDMAMPDIQGTQFAKSLIEIRPDIPIIICSGYSEKLDNESAKALGIMGYIKKPIRTNEMSLKIRLVLDQVLDRKNKSGAK
ncbi:MAG: response regulator [Proteobacteria bacterium]|nr:response regulator [Desulfobacula sp.]MBU3951846.1 response regulator [Pseudomonadota bacterium]MBU4130686.1 response regulator [Pseudomonadota bacterium]